MPGACSISDSAARPAPASAPANGCARSHGCACIAPPPRGRPRSAFRRSHRTPGGDGNNAAWPRSILWRIFGSRLSAGLLATRYRFLKSFNSMAASGTCCSCDIRRLWIGVFRPQRMPDQSCRSIPAESAIARGDLSRELPHCDQPAFAAHRSQRCRLWTNGNPSNPPLTTETDSFH